ncbi:unnamed protein product [Adineta steineri]|uniref:G-protein coupled receptors family 1 profile domain-containing protein n=1 Tax=Adineta steineri TaxID=433720 RepID=A0A814TGJ3_9BILA|nr:unnamed protein product [Adineta steineri]CAF1161169.1 unnamed protein product [Adineta steineri]
MSNIIDTINYLNQVTTILVVTICLASFIPGVIGLLLNLIVFTRPSLRHEPCAFYFFSSTCLNLFIILIIVPVRILSNGFNTDLADRNLGISCIDRYLHSSSNARMCRLSSLKIARLAVGSICIFSIISYVHMIIYYEIGNTTNQFGVIIPKCNARKGFYRTFNALW